MTATRRLYTKRVEGGYGVRSHGGRPRAAWGRIPSMIAHARAHVVFWRAACTAAALIVAVVIVAAAPAAKRRATLVVTGGTIITMDAQRRVLSPGAVAI